MSSLPRKIRPIALNVQQQTDCPTSIVMMSSRVRALRRISRIPEPDKTRLFSVPTYSADEAMREEQNLPDRQSGGTLFWESVGMRRNLFLCRESRITRVPLLSRRDWRPW